MPSHKLDLSPEQEPAAPGAFFPSWRHRIPQGCKSSRVLERMSKSLLLVPLDGGVKISLAAKIHWPCWILLLVLTVSPAALCLGSLPVSIFSFKFVFHSSVFSDTWGGNAAQSYLSCVCSIPVLQKESFKFWDQTTVKLHPISPFSSMFHFLISFSIHNVDCIKLPIPWTVFLNSCSKGLTLNGCF